MWIALLFAMFINQSAPAVCDQLTNAEVAPLIGAVKTRQPLFNADTCVWTGDQRTLTIVRTADVDTESGIALLQAMKTRVRPGDVAIDEPGIGQRAVSESIGKGQRVAIVGIAGTTSWTIGVDHVYGGMSQDDLLPKLRVVAKKLVR